MDPRRQAPARCNQVRSATVFEQNEIWKTKSGRIVLLVGNLVNDYLVILYYNQNGDFIIEDVDYDDLVEKLDTTDFTRIFR